MPTDPAPTATFPPAQPGTIGLALGGGSARGWAHIGIIQELAEIGINPDFVAGTSIGAVVGAAWATDNLERFEHWVCGLGKLDIARFFALPFSSSGFVDNQRLRATLAQELCEEITRMELLHRSFATVATDLDSGAEVWLQQGKVLDAVWGSICLPGLFTPMQHQAERVIAVNLARGQPAMRNNHPQRASSSSRHNGLLDEISDRVRQYSTTLFHSDTTPEAPPGLVDAIVGSIWIVQEQLTRSRIAAAPPELLLAPDLGDIGLLEFHRGKEAIAEGRDLVKRNRAALEQLVR